MGKVENRGVMAFAAAVATLLPLLPLGAAAAPTAAAATGPGSNCKRSCGGIDIPYPFGIEPGCYHGLGFNLTCRDETKFTGDVFLGDGTVQVLGISVSYSIVRINSTCLRVEAEAARPANRTWGSGLPVGGPYFLSESVSKLEVIGCQIQVNVLGGVDNTLVSSCTAICPQIEHGGGRVFYLGNGSCATGVGCCQASIILGYSFYNIQINRLDDPLIPVSVYIADQQIYYNNTDIITGVSPEKALPATLDWVINNSTCPPANMTAPECLSTHSYCQNSSSRTHDGYTCRCFDGYQGNPYVSDSDGGCYDIDECRSPDIYHCYGDCENTPGSFKCHCSTGYTGNTSIPNGCIDINECEHPETYPCYGSCQNFNGSFLCQCPNGTNGNPFTIGGCITIKKSFTGLIIGLGVGGGTCILLLALGGPFVMRKIKLRKMKKMRQKFFNQNHGLLLQQLISRNSDIGERMIISLRELEKATNNFDIARVVGGGGHGVVYKGILDLNVVAIKKSKIVVQREINEFINEVVVLSQLNHRNVVKLLGCCLETAVPLLVYEFISNGTLYSHLHTEEEIGLPWADRMRIAKEVARAISYLHSAASMPIFHRDIKSPNILLDDNLTAKVSDFGASRYIPIDRTGVTTAIQGTMGYLDPMYHYTGRLTDKSDVFSFGVLLIELLTRKKPYSYRSDDGDGLVSHFASLFREEKLVDIIDRQILEEEDGDIQEVAALATICTKLKGEDRPTMREVEMRLENLIVKEKKVPCDTTTRTNENETTSYGPIERVTRESSRQYTMEEEILLSATYPR